MKIGLILLLLFSISTYSQKSTNYHGEELKVYPFKQKAGIQFNSNYWNRGTKKEIKEHSKEYGFNLYDSGKDIFLPLGTIADGKYIQMVDQDHTFEYTGIKEKRLNFHENEIPYAIFNVSGNKLNGAVYFLSPIGDTITKGFYKNNMRHGKWNVEPTNQNVITYNEGLYHGEYKFYYKYNSRKKRSNKRIKTEFFDNDDLVSSVELYSGKDEENIVTKKLMDPNIKNQFSVVAKKNGNIDYQGSYEGERETGNWKYYYPNGALKANVQFTDDTTYLGESFVRWYNQIFNFKPHTAFDIHGIYSKRYRSEEVVTLSYINYNSTIKSPRAHADASFFYDNGQKKFSYTIIDEEFVPDTLFYKNGNPKFVMLKDERTKEFVSEFFDVDGVKTNQERNDFEGKRIVGESYMMFKGLKLEGGKSHNIFKYEHTPSYEEIADSEDTLVYTYIEFENANLTHQIYYLPHQKVRVEKRDMDWESPYYNYITTEKRQYFNEDYTECRTEIVTTVGSKFKIFQEYDAVYSMSFYDAEEDGEKLDGMINKRSPIRNVRQGTTNYFSYYVSANTDNTRIAEVKISNLKTEYAYKNKPFEGKLKVDFDGGGRGLKINKRKILISSYSSSGFLDYDNMVLRDGFNASYHHNDLLLMPNLYSEIPSFNGSPFKEIKKVKGQFENGKFEGDFAYRNYRNKKIIETTYEQNKLTGQLTYYRFRKREKRTWNSNYVQKREYHKIQVVNFEDNQMKDALLLNLREDTLAYMTYENGLATKGVFYNKFRNMIVSDDADKETFLLEKGIPQSLHIEFKKGHEYTYLFQDGLLHGKHEFRLDSGSYNHGVFTGVFKQNKGHGIIHKEFVQDGLVLKELVLNSDDVLLSQIVYDTNEVKLNGSVYNTYQISPHVTFVQAQENITGSKIAAEGEFTSYYVNGEVHAEGILTENIMQPRGGQWKYYNPDGELMSKVSYQRSFEFFNNIEDLTTFGEIEIYNENKLVSKGAVIDLIEKYNCSDADSYEVRQLAILEDYVGGEVIKYPSRYHKTYYDMGVLQAEGELVKGVPSGIWKFYDRQGGLRSVGNYMSGKKEGRWLEGDLTGLGFIGDFCISPGSYEIRKEFLETNIELNIQMFEEGEMKSHRLFKAKVDK